MINTERDSPSNTNADIQYLMQIFQSDLNLLETYYQNNYIQSSTNNTSNSQKFRPFVKTFIDASKNSYEEGAQMESQTRNHSYLVDFIDYGSKIMSYLSRNSFLGTEIQDQGISEIMNMIVDPQLIISPIQEVLLLKKQKVKEIQNGNLQMDKNQLDLLEKDIQLLFQCLSQLRQPEQSINKDKIIKIMESLNSLE